MTFVDHLKGSKQEALVLEVAFGRHIIAGDLAKSVVTGADPTHVVTVQHMLGETFGKGWKGPVGVWFRGVNRDSSKYKFYPGIISPGNGDSVQGIDSVFDQDTPHSNRAWIRLECPNGAEVGIPDFNTKDNPPLGHSGVYDCQLGDIYNESGEIIASDELLVNPADVLAFGCKEIRQYPNSRINWVSLETLRQFSDVQELPDYTTLPHGVGLTGRYYDGASFGTLKWKRVDPVVQFDLSAGAPALDIDPVDFAARHEGKIRFKYDETYTIYLTHNDSGKLWLDDLGTALIDQASAGTHSATFDATADAFVDVRIDWANAGGDSQIMLEWESTSQPRQVIPQDRLYPKNEPIPRFRTHIAITQPTSFDDFLRAVLFTCNGAVQDVNGKLTFFSIDQIGTSFDFDGTNTVKNTFKYSPRFTQLELLQLPNRYIADGRDLDSQYLEKFDPPLYYDVPELQEIAGRIIEETVAVGNTNRWQALRNLAHYAKLRTSPRVCEFTGMPQTLPVLQGDKVRVSQSLMNWTNKEFLAVEATDLSFDAGPDNRFFRLLDWSGEF